MNGQQFLTRVAGQEMSGTLQSQLLLAPARDRYLLTGTTALSNEINSKSFLEKTTQGVSTSGEIMTVKYNGADLALVIQGDKPVFYGLPRHQFSSGEIQFLENNGLKMMTFSDGRKIVYNPEKVANVLASDSAFYGAKGTTQEEILSTIFDKEKAMNGGELLGYGSRTMGGETGGLSIGAGGENYAYGFTGDNPAKMEMILRKNAQTLADISNEPVWVEINKKVIDIIMPTKEPLLLTEGIYANGRLLLNPANEEGESFVAIGSAIRENPPTEFLKSYNAFVDDQPLLTKVAQSIDPEASAINFLATKNTPPALMSFKLNADGDIVLDHIPLTHVTQESLETKVQTVLMHL